MTLREDGGNGVTLKPIVMEENMTLCQSCGMPLTQQEEFGTDADGKLIDEYCIYCYKDGKFEQDVSMEQMIEHNLQFLDEFNKDAGMKMTKEEARAGMKEFFPTLKRWKK